MAEIGDIVTASADAGADFFLRAAQAAVRRYCGWHVSPAAEVSGTLPSMGQRVFALPLRAISSLEVEVADPSGLVYVEAEEGGDYVRSGRLIEFRRYVPPSVAAVRYTATAGFAPEEVPDVQSVIVQAARRAAQAPAGAVKSQSVNGASVSYGFSGSGAPAVALLSDELAVLAPYRIGGNA